MNKQRYKLLLAICLLLFVSMPQAAEQVVAKTEMAKGKVKVSHPKLNARELKTGDDIHLKDLIITAERSFSVLKFLDDGKVTVRPNSVFSVSEFNNEKKTIRMNLDKGGLGLAQGSFGTKSPESVVVETPLVTVTGQQAKFNIRLCNDDCAEEAGKGSTDEKPISAEVVARVIDRHGDAYAQSIDTRTSMEKRRLALGAPVYRSDQLFTGKESYLLVAFRDGGRVALKSGSKFIVEDYRFKEPGQANKAMFRFVRGGMRAVTGTLGKTDQGDYSLETPVATVGIRGTVFDLLGDCDCEGAAIPGLIKGLYAAVYEGAIVLKNGKGEIELGQGQAAHVSGWKAAARRLKHYPQGMTKAHARNPGKKKVDLNEMFNTEKIAGVPPGLYLYAEDGHIRLISKRGPNKGKILNLGRYEAAYVGRDGELTRLSKPKSFQLKK